MDQKNDSVISIDSYAKIYDLLLNNSFRKRIENAEKQSLYDGALMDVSSRISQTLDKENGILEYIELLLGHKEQISDFNEKKALTSKVLSQSYQTELEQCKYVTILTKASQPFRIINVGLRQGLKINNDIAGYHFWKIKDNYDNWLNCNQNDFHSGHFSLATSAMQSSEELIKYLESDKDFIFDKDAFNRTRAYYDLAVEFFDFKIDQLNSITILKSKQNSAPEKISETQTKSASIDSTWQHEKDIHDVEFISSHDSEEIYICINNQDYYLSGSKYVLNFLNVVNETDLRYEKNFCSFVNDKIVTQKKYMTYYSEVLGKKPVGSQNWIRGSKQHDNCELNPYINFTVKEFKTKRQAEKYLDQ